MTRIGYYPDSNTRNNATMFLEELAQKDPDQVVFYWVDFEAKRRWLKDQESPLEHQQILRGDFTGRIARVATGLDELGLASGDRAILFVPMSVELYVLMAALQRIGAIPVFIDSWARRDQLGAVAQMVEPRALISFEMAFQLCATVPDLVKIPLKIAVGPTQNSYSARYEELLAAKTKQAVTPVEQEHPGLITFTTGSSGKPKGANRTHRFLAAQHYAINSCIPYKADDIDLPVFPVFSLNNIAAGVTTVIPALDVGTPGKNDAAILGAQFKACGVTCATLNPFLLNEIASKGIRERRTIPGLRRVVTGGAPISRDNLLEITTVCPNAEVWVLYGSTEVEPMAHIEAQEMISFKTRAAEDPEWVDEGVNVGHFAEGLRYKFLAIHDGPIEVRSAEEWASLEVPDGEVGELIVAGEHVCRDYYNFPEAFKKAKIRDVDGTIWHRTGDLARLDSQGYLWIVGRVHNVIRRGDSYCFPVRAEIIFKKLPFVKEAAYLGLPDPDLGEKAAGVIVPQQAEALADEALLGRFRSEVERIIQKNGVELDELHFLEKIPMDPRHHSKVEYGLLRQQLTDKGVG